MGCGGRTGEKRFRLETFILSLLALFNPMDIFELLA
jgi:hypothetical protein